MSQLITSTNLKASTNRRNHPTEPKKNRPGANRDSKRHHRKARDANAESTRAANEAAHMLALKQRMGQLRERLEALERHAREEKAKQKKLLLRELVKEARARIVEANGIPTPASKQTWKHCLQSLTPQQLDRAHVSAKRWREVVEVLSPSARKLNDWVHGYSTWQAARVIHGMDSAVRAAWGELFKVTHFGESFEEYVCLREPSMAEGLATPR